MFYDINIKNKKIYREILKILKDNCDVFALVNESIEDLGNYIPPTISKLAETCIKEENVNRWPGNKSGRKRYTKRYVHKVCKSSMDVLKQFSNFFEIEDQMDIAFYKDKECILYTVSHEGDCMCKGKYFADYILKNNIEYIKSPGYIPPMND